MTTITSRSLPLIPLPIPLSQIINQSDGNNLILRTSPNEMSRMSPHSTNDMQNHDDGQSTIDGTSEARSSPLSSIQTDNYNKDDPEDDGDERMSYCSDDSELSVGKEDIERINNSEQRLSIGGNRNNSIDILQQQQLNHHMRRPSLDTTNEETSNDSMRFAVSRLPQLAKDHDGLRFPLVRPSPTRFQEEFLRSSQLYAEELMKQQMSIVAAARGLNMSPKNQLAEHSALALRRNLEESVKVGFRPHIRLGGGGAVNNGISDIDQPSRSPENFSFRGIHSHLNAISQITQNIQKITTTPTLSMASRENSQSPPTNYNHNHLHPLHPLHHHHQHLMNNNLNDANLKFSIDNILKADFGRRITEPLKRKSSSQHKRNSKSNQNNTSTSSSTSSSASSSSLTNTNNNNNNNSASSKHSGLSAIDLTSSTASSTTISASAAAALAEKQNCSNSNDETSSVTSNSASNNSNGGDNSMIWPAWVYCTRYSDRPSSGMWNKIIF